MRRHVCRYLKPEVMDKLCEKFFFKGFIGDQVCHILPVLKCLLSLQDWWNLVVWASPPAMAPLPCSFNFQTTEQFNTGPWKEVRGANKVSKFNVKTGIKIFRNKT